jgi:hypothetical protein
METERYDWMNLARHLARGCAMTYLLTRLYDLPIGDALALIVMNGAHIADAFKEMPIRDLQKKRGSLAKDTTGSRPLDTDPTRRRIMERKPKNAPEDGARSPKNEETAQE